MSKLDHHTRGMGHSEWASGGVGTGALNRPPQHRSLTENLRGRKLSREQLHETPSTLKRAPQSTNKANRSKKSRLFETSLTTRTRASAELPGGPALAPASDAETPIATGFFFGYRGSAFTGLFTGARTKGKELQESNI